MNSKPLANDPFTTISPSEAAEESAKELMYQKYLASRVDRALKRKVRVQAEGIAYHVQGESSLGDSYSTYTVSYNPVTRKYHCSCHQSKGGEYRNKGRRMCTHVVAVDYHRTVARYKGQFNEPDGPAAPVIKPDIRPADAHIDFKTQGFKTQAPKSEAKPLTIVAPSKTVKIVPDVDHCDLPSLSDPEWGTIPFPAKFKALRPQQWMAIKEIVQALNDPNIKAVFLDAPTGSGKTLIGECVRRLMGMPTLYLCTTKTLQQQFIDDFPYAALLQGKANYPTQNYPDRFRLGDDGLFSDSITCADCAKKKVPISCLEAECYDPHCQGDHWKWHCSLCDDPDMCAYTIAKNTALNSDLAILNIAYFLAEANGPGRFTKRDLIILDEADSVERSLLSYVEVNISANLRKRLNIGLPEKKTVPESWQEWIEKECLPAVEEGLVRSRDKLKGLGGEARIKESRWRRRLERLRQQLKNCAVGDGTWVYTGYQRKNTENVTVTFKPIKVDAFAPELLWEHSRKWLLMSATFIDPYGMAQDLGLPLSSIHVVQMPSQFSPDKRPVYIIPRANMSYKTHEEEMPAMVKAVRDVMNAYPDERILVHSVSYKLTNALITSLNSPRIVTYGRANERDKALERFRNTPKSVLIAPSLDRGVDLPDDECRVVVIAKIPFPDLADKQTAARLYSKGGGRWYASTTVRTMCQMSGRAMRSPDDYCDIYILDRQFVSNLWRKNKNLFPKWWRDAVVMSGSPKVSF